MYGRRISTAILATLIVSCKKKFEGLKNLLHSSYAHNTAAMLLCAHLKRTTDTKL